MRNAGEYQKKIEVGLTIDYIPTHLVVNVGAFACFIVVSLMILLSYGTEVQKTDEHTSRFKKVNNSWISTHHIISKDRIFPKYYIDFSTSNRTAQNTKNYKALNQIKGNYSFASLRNRNLIRKKRSAQFLIQLNKTKEQNPEKYFFFKEESPACKYFSMNVSFSTEAHLFAKSILTITSTSPTFHQVCLIQNYLYSFFLTFFIIQLKLFSYKSISAFFKEQSSVKLLPEHRLLFWLLVSTIVYNNPFHFLFRFTAFRFLYSILINFVFRFIYLYLIALIYSPLKENHLGDSQFYVRKIFYINMIGFYFFVAEKLFVLCKGSFFDTFLRLTVYGFYAYAVGYVFYSFHNVSQNQLLDQHKFLFNIVIISCFSVVLALLTVLTVTEPDTFPKHLYKQHIKILLNIFTILMALLHFPVLKEIEETNNTAKIEFSDEIDDTDEKTDEPQENYFDHAKENI